MLASASLAMMAVLSVTPAAPVGAATSYERAPITTERGTCIPGEHHRLRVRRLPGTATHSDRHRELNEDAYVHCSDQGSEPARAGRPPRVGKEPSR